MARYYSYVDSTVGLGSTTVQNMISNGSEYGVVPSVDIVARNITATGNFIGTISNSSNVFTDLKVTGIATIGIVTGATYYGDGSQLTGISADSTKIETGNTKVETIDTGSDGHVKITTEGTERFRIDSSGNMGLGTASPGDYLSSAHQLVISDAASTGITIATPTSSSGTIAFADGTGVADNSRGLIRYGHSDNSLQFFTNAIEAMRIDSSGRLLLGTYTNQGDYLLQVKDGDISSTKLMGAGGGNAANMLRFRVHNTNNTAQSSTLGGISAETVAAWGGALTFSTKTANSTPDESVTERMRIDNFGRVGLGTDSPSYSLHLSGSGNQYAAVTSTNSANAGILFGDSSNNDAGYVLYVNSVDSLLFGTGNATERMRINGSGYVAIGGNIITDSNLLNIQGSGATKNIGIVLNDTNASQIYGISNGSSSLKFYDYTANAERMRIDSSGRLLVGTNSSTGSHKLEVNGGTDNEPIKVVSSDEGAYITFEDDDTTGSTRLGAVDNDFKIDVSSAERMRISSAGMVQIDTNDIKVRDITVGRGPGNKDTDTVVGQDALANRTTGSQSVAVGRNALTSCTTGSYNVAVGYNAHDSATTGYANTIVGAYSMATATTASLCCSFGTDSLNANTAWYNNAFGKDALRYNTTGYANAAFGYRTLRANTTASANTAFGTEALDNNTTAWSNAAFGAYALKANTTGASNVAVGRNALYSNTTASSNTSVGRSSMYSNTTGVQNSSVGKDSLYDNTTGQNNQALGFRSLRKNTTGNENVAIGRDSGYFNTTGSGNISIGVVNSSGSYAPVFGLSTSNNRVVMGSTAVTNAYVQVAWTVVSDARDKMNFGTVPHGLEFIKQLNPVSFQFKFARDSDTPNGPVRYGFKAQDILALEGEDNSVIIDNDDPDKLRYNGESLVPVLVNAIKEQQTIIDTLIARLDAAGI